jgi:hypothetical protein
MVATVRQSFSVGVSSFNHSADQLTSLTYSNMIYDFAAFLVCNISTPGRKAPGFEPSLIATRSVISYSFFHTIVNQKEC